MEARVAKFEDQFARIGTLLRSVDDHVRKLQIDAAETKGRIANLPTTWAMVTAVIGGQVALAGILIAALRLVPPH